jgi:hypothetical protein
MSKSTFEVWHYSQNHSLIQTKMKTLRTLANLGFSFTIAATSLFSTISPVHATSTIKAEAKAQLALPSNNKIAGWEQIPQVIKDWCFSNPLDTWQCLELIRQAGGVLSEAGEYARTHADVGLSDYEMQQAFDYLDRNYGVSLICSQKPLPQSNFIYESSSYSEATGGVCHYRVVQ